MKSTSKKLTFIFIFSFTFFLFNSTTVRAQFWTEDFVTTNLQPDAVANGYVGVNGTWTETQLGGNTGADANKFYVSCTEAGMQAGNCGAVCPAGPPPPPTPFIAQSLHVGSVPFPISLCPSGDCGATYSAGDGGLGISDASTEVRAESPIINCTGQTNITLTFNYLEYGDGTNDNGEVWYFNGVTWALLLDINKTDCGDGTGAACNVTPCGNFMQGIWTASPNITLPASANNNPNVKIGFRWVNNNDGVGTDPSFAITRIRLTTPSSANTITAGNLVGPFCAGANPGLPFQSTGTFTAGNVYTAQLSDASGSFTTPVNLGTFPSTALVGNISLNIPVNTPTGTGYLIRIISSAPSATSTAIGPITINAAVPLSVAVTANPGTAICPGQCVTFNTTVTNGGVAPTYQWQINGVNAPAPSTADSLISCSLQNGDLVTVIVTSNLACVSNSPDTSAVTGPITTIVGPPLNVAVTANPGTAICPGQCVTFNTTVTNGGVAPTYQWQINGVNAPGTSTEDSLTSCILQNGDVVTVIVTSNLACVSNSPDTSAALNITNISALPFSATLQIQPNPVCIGAPIKFTTTTVNGGNPTFAWTINNILLPGIDTAILDYVGVPIPLANDAKVCVIATSSLVGCVTNSPDTICDTVKVLSGVIPTVNITSDTASICVGATMNFSSTYTNSGTNPLFQWYIGSTAVPAPAGTDSIFSTTTLVDGDTVSLQLVSSLSCVSTPTAYSNSIIVDVLPFETPTLSIVPNSGICPGQLITFVTSETSAGLFPIYKWYVNDTVFVGSGNNLTINSSIFTDGDDLNCIMYSSYACLNEDSVISNDYSVFLLNPATLDVGPDVSITYGETFRTDPEINGIVNLGYYLWTPDSTLSCNTCINPIANPTVSTAYVLVYRNSNGCIATDTLNIEVKPNYEVFIPSGFSPNADNINDVFYARGPYIKSINMKIWDRLGGPVFESNYLAYGWDGTKNFKDVNTGVYIYYIKVEFLDGVTKEYKGNITLSR